MAGWPLPPDENSHSGAAYFYGNGVGMVHLRFRLY
jgi:hypothetical protein